MAPQCSSHQLFEKFLENGMKHLSEKLTELTEALTAQSRANGEAIGKVLDGQAERRELCGKRGAMIEALQESDEEQWKKLDVMTARVDNLYKHLWMAVGAVGAIAFAVNLIFK